MSLRDELQRLHDENGELTAALVVEAARPKTSPLHSRFTWDNREAAEQWRQAQAAELIRSVRVIYRQATETEEARSVREYHAVRGPAGYAYQPADKVAADPFLKQLVLNDMQREWLALRRRYEHFSEFVQMVRADVEEAA
jgi:hypothetical protein